MNKPHGQALRAKEKIPWNSQYLKDPIKGIVDLGKVHESVSTHNKWAKSIFSQSEWPERFNGDCLLSILESSFPLQISQIFVEFLFLFFLF